jgi:hypothetical protein
MPDPLIRLTDAAKLPWLPARRGGGRLNLATLWRWALKGLRARDGTTVKLQAIRVGETLCTSEAWLREFFDHLTEHDPALVNNAFSPRTAKRREWASERAARELSKMGI